MLAELPDEEADAGPRQAAEGVERFCVATRRVRPVAEMIRFVVGPDGEIVPDIRRKLPGRGVWVTGSRAVVAQAVRRNAFARGFKREVRVDPDLAGLVERLLERAALETLGMAQKAGRVAVGFGRVENALAAERVVALIEAADAGADGSRKIAAAARRRLGAEAHHLARVDAFTSAQLDLALGRPNVVHAALLAGPASDGFLARYGGLERFRTIGPSEGA